MKKCINVFIFCLFCYISVASAQSVSEARELIKIGEYEKALPIFEEEYAAKPTDLATNLWYGVCLFETNTDLKKAEEYISLAAKRNFQDASIYLSKLLFKTYRFDAAQTELDRYAKLKRRDKVALAQVESTQNELDALERFTLRCENIQIIDSIVVYKDDFLTAYKLSPSGGHLDSYKDAFSSTSAVNSTVYFNEKETKIYYAKPSGSNNIFSLFSMDKLLDDYGNEKRLSSDNFGMSGRVNYPFVMPDGVTIYFAAEDKNGIGEYDLYVTRYNMNNDSYLTPERLSAPFNSPYNDYMMVVDEEKGVGWFASDRYQPEGKVCIYTFIPNDQVNLIESDDDQYIANRAKISAIKDSWKPGVNYSKQIALARQSIKKEVAVINDFEFVINDRYTYVKFSDFKNSQALNSFKQSIDLKKNLIGLNSRLQDLRDSYRDNKTPAKANEILELEQRVLRMDREIKQLEISARNQEISSLNR